MGSYSLGGNCKSADPKDTEISYFKNFGEMVDSKPIQRALALELRP